jgi:hypothetical protein
MKAVILAIAALFCTDALAQSPLKSLTEKTSPSTPAAPAAAPAVPAAPAAAPATPAVPAAGRANQALQAAETKAGDAEKKAGEEADAKLTEGEKKVGVPGAAGQAKAAAAKEGQKAKKAKAKGQDKAKGAADKVGVTTSSVSTTWLGGATDLTKPLDPRLEQVISQMIGSNYRDFLALVAERRKSTPEKVNEVAQGRVWTGAQAKERGLVDALGGVDDAVKSAARRASLGEGYRVEYIEHESRGLNRYLALLFERVAAFAQSNLGWDGLAKMLLGPSAGQVQRDLEMLDAARRQPLSAFSYCFCELRQTP